MRIRIAVVLMAIASALPARAVDEATRKAIRGTGTYGAAGCGLGSMVFGDQPGGVQILAATTNDAIFPKTFAMSTGTSNCQPGAFAQGTRDFVEANREMLAKDIARGQGEAIGALTQINACADSSAVGAALQKEFAAIFPSERASTDDITKAILHTLHHDASLGCGRG